MTTTPRFVARRLTLSGAGLLALFCMTPGRSRAQAQNVAMHVPPGTHATQFAATPLKDPAGKTHTSQELHGKVVVVIMSAPNSSQGGAQQKWSKLLADQEDTKLPAKVSLMLVEDMPEAGMFKGIAMDKMKKEFKPDSRPLLLLDEDGHVFSRFGVPKDKTEILIFDKHGRLRDVETKLDDQSTTVQRIKAITTKLA